VSRRVRLCCVEGCVEPCHGGEPRCSEHAYSVQVKRDKAKRSSTEMLAIKRQIRYQLDVLAARDPWYARES
jgi:hypothetical protein